MKPLRLTIELIPEPLWGVNLRSHFTKTEWDAIAAWCHSRAGHKCEICGGVGKKHVVEAHERWHYDDTRKIQKLEGLIALCPSCHHVKHYARSCTVGLETHVRRHFLKINQCSFEEMQAYLKESQEEWESRSEFQWTHDISWVEKKEWLNPIEQIRTPTLETYQVIEIRPEDQCAVVRFQNVIQAIKAFDQSGKNPHGPVPENPEHCPVLYSFAKPPSAKTQIGHFEDEHVIETPGTDTECRPDWGIGDLTPCKGLSRSGYITRWKYIFVLTRSFRPMEADGAHRVYKIETTAEHLNVGPQVRECRLLINDWQDEKYYNGAYLIGGHKSGHEWTQAVKKHPTPPALKHPKLPSWLLSPEILARI